MRRLAEPDMKDFAECTHCFMRNRAGSIVIESGGSEETDNE